MSTVSTVVEALVATLEAAIPEIDQASTAGYLPAVESQGVALIATALGHSDEGYIYSAGWMHAVHRVRLEFWAKLDVSNPTAAITTIRDIGYRAMRALMMDDVTGGYTLAATGSNLTMSGKVDDTPLDPGASGIPYLRYVLSVPVMQKE